MAWAPDYVSTVELRNYLGVADALDDVELAVWATSASRAVDRKTNRQFGLIAAPAARVYYGVPFYDPECELWCLEIDDVQDVAGMTVGGVAFASSGAVLLPANAPADGVPWQRLGFVDIPSSPLSVVARWGWTAVPTQVPGACRLQAARWNARRYSPLGVAGSPESGSEIRLLARLDPDVGTTLTGLARRRRAG